MKKWTYFVLMTFQLLAWAKSDQPDFMAEMSLGESNSKFAAPQNRFVLYEYGFNSKKKSFTFEQTYNSAPCPPGYFCLMPSTFVVNHHYTKVKSYSIGCGNILYRGVEIGDINSGAPGKVLSKMELVDHRNQTCKYRKIADWEFTVIEADKKKEYYTGNPVPYVDPTDCSKINSGMYCTMIYAPATCLVTSINGEKLDPAIKINDGNSCLAMQKIRQTACERGYDADMIADDEVQCEFEPIESLENKNLYDE